MQKRLLALSLLIISGVSSMLAQENIPYSSKGLGDLQSGLFTNQVGMGGLSAAQSSYNTVNYQNPAGLGNITYTVFAIDAYANLSTIKDKDSSATGGNATLANIVLAFPIMRTHWGAAIGLQSVSNQQYNVYQNVAYNGYPYSAVQQQTGTGGTYRFFMAHGFRFKIDSNNHLQLGVRGEYMFGSLQNTNLYILQDSLNSYNSRQEIFNRIGGFVFGGGFQYETTYKHNTKKHTITLGANVSMPGNVPVHQYQQWDRYNTVGVRDTVYENIIDGNLHMPLTGSAGIMWTGMDKNNNDHLRIGAQYDFSNWQDYRFMGASDSLGKSWRASVGVEYLPLNKEGDAQRVKYRIGFYTGQTNILFNNTPQHIYGLTLGLGYSLPHAQLEPPSEINIALELGTQGTTNNGQLREDFFRLHVGFSLNGYWFRHRKFD